MEYNTSIKDLLDFVRSHQIVPESAKITSLPSAVQHIVGREFKGGWWSLPNSSVIYNVLQEFRESPEIIICKLAKGKVTFIHKNAYLPLVSLENFFYQERWIPSRNATHPRDAMNYSLSLLRNGGLKSHPLVHSCLTRPKHSQRSIKLPLDSL